MAEPASLENSFSKGNSAEFIKTPKLSLCGPANVVIDKPGIIICCLMSSFADGEMKWWR